MTMTEFTNADPSRSARGRSPGAAPPRPGPPPATVGLPRRGIALAIDYGVLTAMTVAIARVAEGAGLAEDLRTPVVALLSFSATVSYFALLESSCWRGTLGKLAAGVRVTGDDGERISFVRGLGRTFAKLLSLLPFGVGFLMAAYSEQHRALHDLLAGTVVRRS
jgi:uncharacterized RDD family membrane protein YckC